MVYLLSSRGGAKGGNKKFWPPLTQQFLLISTFKRNYKIINTTLLKAKKTIKLT